MLGAIAVPQGTHSRLFDAAIFLTLTISLHHASESIGKTMQRLEIDDTSAMNGMLDQWMALPQVSKPST